MDFQFGKREEALRREIREFVKAELPHGWLMSPFEQDCRAEDWPFAMSIAKKLGQKGWLAISWPKEYGGRGASSLEQLVYREEAGYWGIPGTHMGVSGVGWIGPCLIHFGTDEQKKKYLLSIASGEPDGIWCTGYSEPDAGSDFGNIRTLAVKKNGAYAVNGQKIWTSAAHHARWMWLAAVTEPNAPRKHQGISIFIVDMKSKGITVNPIINFIGHHAFNEVFFDDVRVPRENLVGDENGGWHLLMKALSYERGFASEMNCGYNRRILDELIQYAKETGLFKEPSIRQKLADCAIDVEVAKILTYQTFWMKNKGTIPVFEPSRDKVFNDSVMGRLAKTGTEVLGIYSQIDPLYRDSKWTKLRGAIENLYWLFPGASSAAGTDEIEKNVIAQFGLKLPKSY